MRFPSAVRYLLPVPLVVVLGSAAIAGERVQGGKVRLATQAPTRPS